MTASLECAVPRRPKQSSAVDIHLLSLRSFEAFLSNASPTSSAAVGAEGGLTERKHWCSSSPHVSAVAFPGQRRPTQK